MAGFYPVDYHAWFRRRPKQVMSRLVVKIPRRVKEKMDEEGAMAQSGRAGVILQTLIKARPDWPWDSYEAEPGSKSAFMGSGPFIMGKGPLREDVVDIRCREGSGEILQFMYDEGLAQAGIEHHVRRQEEVYRVFRGILRVNPAP